MALRLRVLGAPLLERDGETVEFRAQDARPASEGARPAAEGGAAAAARSSEAIRFDTPEVTALLAYLAVTGRGHDPAVLAALCWPAAEDPAAALRRAAAFITRTAGAILRDDGGRIALDFTMVSVDHRLVRELQAEVDAHDHPPAHVCAECVAPLTAIARLHRGRFLDGFSLPGNSGYARWQERVADELDRAFTVALARLGDAHVLVGGLDAAAEVARRRIALDPLDEAAHRQLMRVHMWRDQPHAALAQYRECVRVLQTVLGVSPLDATTRLSEDVLAGRLPPAPSSSATWAGAEPAGVAAPAGAGSAGLAEPAEAEPAGTAASRRRPHFVGREHELATLSDAMARVHSDGLVIAIEGEAGLGKTRLAREFGARSRRDGRRVLEAACHPAEAGAPYGVLIELLRSALPVGGGHDWLADLRPDTARELGRLLPEAVAVGGPPPPAAGPGAVWRLVEALGSALCAAASAPLGEQLPGVVIIDDAQWIDESSLRALTHLAERLQGRPVGLVLLWRTDLVGRGHRLRRVVSDLARSQPVRQLPLDRLDHAAVRALSADILGADTDRLGGLPERGIVAAEGIPRMLVDHLWVLVTGAGGAHGPALRSAPLPDAEQALLARTADLSPVQWQVLTAGAVIGRPFDARTVRHVSGRTAAEVDEALAALARVGLLTGPDAPSGYHDVAGEDLRSFVCVQGGPVRRRLLHGRAAAALERDVRVDAPEPSLAACIAAHHRDAGDHAAAAAWFGRAGAVAAGMLAVVEAAAHHEAALALGPAQPYRVHEALGDLHLLEGQYGQALDRYEAAAALAVGMQLPALEHKIAGVYLRLGRWVLAEQHLAIALSGLEEHTVGTTALGARILTDRGLVAQRRGHDGEAVTSARAALRAAEETEDLGALAGAHNLLGVLNRQDLSKAREHLEQALECARALRDADIEITAADNLAQVHAAAGALERALPLAESALARAGQMGDRHREATLRNTLADLLRAAGRHTEAMAHLKRAVALFAEIDEPDDQPPEAWKLATW